ncbi:DNA topoisomerase III, partial [Thiocapsa imhoffii]
VDDPQLRQKLKETSGIGTEATRAGIIETLQQRGYLIRRKRALHATEAGRALIDAVPEAVSDPATTARWEEALGEIAEGRGDLAAFLEQQAAWVRTLVRQIQEAGAEAIAIDGSAQPTCPSCGRSMRRRTGKHGAFWGCSGYPDCTVTRPDANGKP